MRGYSPGTHELPGAVASRLSRPLLRGALRTLVLRSCPVRVVPPLFVAAPRLFPVFVRRTRPWRASSSCVSCAAGRLASPAADSAGPRADAGSTSSKPWGRGTLPAGEGPRRETQGEVRITVDGAPLDGGCRWRSGTPRRRDRRGATAGQDRSSSRWRSCWQELMRRRPSGSTSRSRGASSRRSRRSAGRWTPATSSVGSKSAAASDGQRRAPGGGRELCAPAAWGRNASARRLYVPPVYADRAGPRKPCLSGFWGSRFLPVYAGSGEEVVRRQQSRGRGVFVVRQPDGTLAHIPTWMCEPSAASLSVVDHARVALAGRRDLRLALDAALSSFSSMQEGERHGDAVGAARRVAGADGARTDADDEHAGDAASAGGDPAARSGATPAGSARDGEAAMSKIAPDHLSRQAFVYASPIHAKPTSGTTKRAGVGVGVGSTGSPTALAGWVGLYEEWACDRWGSRTRPWLSPGNAQRSTDGCSRWAPSSSSGACGALTVAAPDRRPSRLPVLAGHRRRPDPGLAGRVVGPRRRDHPSNRTRHPVRALHVLVFDVDPKVNPCCQLSLRASSASTPSSAARSRPALPLSSPGAYASPASCSMPSARSPPSPRPGSSAVGGDRWAAGASFALAFGAVLGEVPSAC